MRSQSLLREAWHLVHGFKKTCWLATFAGLGVVVLLLAITYPLHLFGKAVGLVHPMYFMTSVITGYFVLPTGLRVFILGLKHARQEPPEPIKIFSYFHLPMMARIFLLTFIFIVLTTLLFMIPSWIFRGIMLIILMYFLHIWIMTNMLFVDRQLTLVPAVTKAIKATMKNGIKVFGFYILLGFLGFMSLITAFIGLIWILPFVINLYAVFYRRCFESA